MSLTPRQQAILEAIREHVAAHGFAPSIPELCKTLGISSSSTVHHHLTTLEKWGYLKRLGNRAYELTQAPKGMPMLGRIAAGEPLLAHASAESFVELDKELGGPDRFLLEVRGESMIDEHITPGDWVVVKQQSTARRGDLVVALVDGEDTTLKRFYPEGDAIRLQPANANMDPIVVAAKRVAIQGIVLAVIRRV